ncbi:DNA internalization-related competence protein ComEC/Rec2 [Candidatus Marinamargulisbacteria bacterium SCGC AG-343-D04]|nr:DNA internalization-related competence protein ComEC/Rec2 [Candidatus Marinamargulisbacteria bacterium SCGC AG-343-D04]
MFHFLPFLTFYIIANVCVLHQIYGFIVFISTSILCFKWFKQTLLLFVCSMFLCFSFYFKFESNQRYSVLNALRYETQATFTGVIVSMKESYFRLLDSNGFYLTVFYRAKDDFSFFPGDYVQVSGSYRFPDFPRNPGQFDSFFYSFIHKRCGSLTLESILLGTEAPWFSIYRVSHMLQLQLSSLYQRTLPSPYDSMLMALIFGESGTALSKELKSLFKDAGLLHALVVSGSQVSLVLSMVAVLLKYLGVYRFYQFSVIIPMSIFFYVLTGGGESVLRAILMANCTLFIKYVLRYRTSPLHIMCFTFLVMLCFDPFIIFKLGAILSFLATFSLVFLVDEVKEKFPRRMPVFCKDLLSMSLSPWLMTTPVLMVYSHVFSLGALISNVLVLFAIEWLVLIGFVATLVGFLVYPVAYYMMYTCLLLMQWIIAVSGWVSSFDWATIYLNPFFQSFGCMALVFFVLYLFYSSLQRYLYHVVGGLAVSLMVYTCFFPVQVTFLDIGQGDSTFIRYRGGSMLIDTGPKYIKGLGKTDQKVLIPFLRSQGVNTLDYLMVTHFDLDHSAHIRSLVEEVGVKRFVHNGSLAEYEELEYFLRDNDVDVQHLCEGDTLRNRQFELSFLQDCESSYKSKNNRSLVMKFHAFDTSILLTGDIEEDTEYSLIEQYGESLRSTFLKVAHHGSKTSSMQSFLSSVNPEYSIISCGLGNVYGHPNPRVLERVKGYSKVLRTDVEGAICLSLFKWFYRVGVFKDSIRYRF